MNTYQEDTYKNDIELTPDDLIYYTDKYGKINAGGYPVNSKFLNEHKPIMLKGGKKHDTTKINLKTSEGENKESDKFDNMVIPAGLLYLHKSLNTPYSDYGTIEVCEMDDVIPDDLFSRLVTLAEIHQKQKKLSRSKKLKPKKNKNTKRNIKY
jgi:hypothetical protein